MQDPKKSPKFAIWAPLHKLSGYIFATKARIDNRRKTCYASICPPDVPNMVNIGPLMAESDWRVWGTPSYFSGYRVLAALLHGSQVVGVSQTSRRLTEGATYIRQGYHHVGHWPTFLVMVALCNRADHYIFILYFLSSYGRPM